MLLAINTIACKKDENNNRSRPTLQQDSLNIRLEIKKFERIDLNPMADSLTREWAMYNSLKNEVERLEDYTIQDLITNMINIESVVDSLQKTIPKKIDTLPVQSRIKILDTKAKFMLEISQKQRPSLNQMKKIAEEYPLEFNALNIQINEIFIELPDFE
jgi:hypothetical protein